MKKENWVWMPHTGHFIGSRSCLFHLNIYVGGFIVSTVGDYQPGGTRESQEIGYNRKFETFVFRAVKSKDKCCPYYIQVDKQVDSQGYTDSGAAFAGHMKLCKKWSERFLGAEKK